MEGDSRISREITGADTPTNCDAELRIKRMEFRVKTRNALQPEFLQAFTEVCDSLRQFLTKNPQYIPALEAISEPDRLITFRVPWFDDKGSLVRLCLQHLRVYSWRCLLHLARLSLFLVFVAY